MDEENETLSEEELAALMRAYKEELARIYRAAAARRAALSGEKERRESDEAMRADIEALKRRYGVRY